MTDTIHALTALLPHALHSHSCSICRRETHALSGSARMPILHRWLTTLRVSEAWLRQHDAEAAKRQDA